MCRNWRWWRGWRGDPLATPALKHALGKRLAWWERVPGWLRIVCLVVLGGASGVVAKLGDESGIRWWSDLGTYPGLWAFIVVVIGRFARAMWVAAVGAMAFFVSMTIGYYAWSSLMMDIDGGRYVYVWMAAAITVVPVLAAAVRWASERRGVAPGLVFATGAGAVVADGTIRQLWLRYVEGTLPLEFPLHPVQAAVNVVCAVVIVTVLPRQRHTRLWAAILFIPMALVARWVIGRGSGDFFG